LRPLKEHPFFNKELKKTNSFSISFALGLIPSGNKQTPANELSQKKDFHAGRNFKLHEMPQTNFMLKLQQKRWIQ
jgi:hypothetical protein